MSLDDAALNQVKADLDSALANASPKAVILFGAELFRAFHERGWLTVETFGAEGTTLFAERVPAYNRTHLVIYTWDVPNYEFRVGKDAPSV
jgi:hypothetical protein